LDLELRGLKVIHVSPEPGPIRHPLDGAFLPGEDASDLLQLLLVPLQVADAVRLQQVQLLVAVLVHGDVFVHEGVEAVIRGGREEGVKRGVNLWRREERWRVRYRAKSQTHNYLPNSLQSAQIFRCWDKSANGRGNSKLARQSRDGGTRVTESALQG